MQMIPADENLFDINVLKEAITFLRTKSLQKEKNDTIWKNRWKISSPQMVVMITREK